ncbi:DinB family protein [Eudoraea chungangensis]|uniref:DinB family protein n=1 Tax=Eudoraea chungangensis TaxID=1481905 RepID=UPI0023ECDBEE|nr:DinB family protein [Eudoraea chungangensis]
MKELIAITQQNRKLLSRILNRFTLDELAEIPEGYRNNIWWNLVHIIVTQQLLVYNLSNSVMRVEDSLIEAYKKGTTPKKAPTGEDLEMINKLLLSTAQWLQEDFDNGLFKKYSPYTTSTGTTIKSIEDALSFNLFHEGLHLGVILSLQKIVAPNAFS